ncbi:hypothetical protein ACVK00_001843 [Burkholderia sp. PvR073]|nr:hypothetical protein [Burkholderia sp. lyk4-R2A-23]
MTGDSKPYIQPYIKPDSHRGELSFGLLLAALRFLFPKLWPEVEQE